MGQIFKKVPGDNKGKPMFLLHKNVSGNENFASAEYLCTSVGGFGDHLEAYADILLKFTDNNCTTILSSKVLNVSEKSRHLLIYNKILLESFDGETKIFVDDSLKLPLEIQDLRQCLIIMAKKKNLVIAYFLHEKMTLHLII